jgi:hypothetical protein
MKIEIISKDEARKWAFELNLKNKFTPDKAMREAQRYVYLKFVYLLLSKGTYLINSIICGSAAWVSAG